MSEEVVINIRGLDVPITDLIADVAAAKKKGLTDQWAFTPETVDGLLEKIQLLTMENNNLKLRLHEINKTTQSFKT